MRMSIDLIGRYVLQLNESSEPFKNETFRIGFKKLENLNFNVYMESFLTHGLKRFIILGDYISF